MDGNWVKTDRGVQLDCSMMDGWMDGREELSDDLLKQLKQFQVQLGLLLAYFIVVVMFYLLFIQFICFLSIWCESLSLAHCIQC